MWSVPRAALGPGRIMDPVSQASPLSPRWLHLTDHLKQEQGTGCHNNHPARLGRLTQQKSISQESGGSASEVGSSRGWHLLSAEGECGPGLPPGFRGPTCSSACKRCTAPICGFPGRSPLCPCLPVAVLYKNTSGSALPHPV